MNSTIISMLLTPGVSKSPILLRLLGISAVLLFSYLGIFTLNQFRNTPEFPQHLSLEQATSLISKQTVWVIIDDIQWDCSNIYYREVNKNTNTEIIFSDRSKNIWGYAIFSGEFTCSEINEKEATGILNYANEKKRTDFVNYGFDVEKHENTSKFLSLCTYCGRNNSLTGVILSTIMVILGTWLFFAANKMEKKRRSYSSNIYSSK